MGASYCSPLVVVAAANVAIFTDTYFHVASVAEATAVVSIARLSSVTTTTSGPARSNNNMLPLRRRRLLPLQLER